MKMQCAGSRVASRKEEPIPPPPLPEPTPKAKQPHPQTIKLHESCSSSSCCSTSPTSLLDQAAKLGSGPAQPPAAAARARSFSEGGLDHLDDVVHGGEGGCLQLRGVGGGHLGAFWVDHWVGGGEVILGLGSGRLAGVGATAREPGKQAAPPAPPPKTNSRPSHPSRAPPARPARRSSPPSPPPPPRCRCRRWATPPRR